MNFRSWTNKSLLGLKHGIEKKRVSTGSLLSIRHGRSSNDFILIHQHNLSDEVLVQTHDYCTFWELSQIAHHRLNVRGILPLSFSIRRLHLNLVSDIYLACHNFGDEGLTVFFEELDFSLLRGYQFVNLFGFAVKEVGNLDLFFKRR